MPTTTWNTTTIDGKQYLVVESAQFRIPLDFDPSSNMFIAVAAPTGGLGNFPALVQGDPGPAPTIDSTINLTTLAYEDTTPDSAVWTETSPDTYQLTLTIHNGPSGSPGSQTILDAVDLEGNPVTGATIVVNAAADGFEFQTPLVGDRYIAATINSTPSGNAGYTLCSVGVPAQNFDWRPEVSGQCIVSPTIADTQVNLIARLNNASAGNIVGQGFSLAGLTPPPIVLSAGPPAGSADGYDRVSAGNSATLYLRAERQTGTGTFTTSATTTSFCVRVCPIPGTAVELGS